MLYGAWCAQTEDINQYLQIDLLKPTIIVAIATQGMAIPSGNWVSSYTLSYSCNGTDWFLYGGPQQGRTVSNAYYSNYLSVYQTHFHD